MGSLFSSPVSSAAGSFIFPAPECSYNWDWDHIIKIQKINDDDYSSCTLSSNNNNSSFIPAFYFRTNDRNIKTTIVYSHGNASDIGQCYHWLKLLHLKLNVNVIGYEYEGYGLHPGISNENNCYNNITTVFKYLISKGVQNSDIILYGQSLGTGPTVELASMYNVKGVILESPYTSIFGVISDVLPHASFCLDPFRNDAKVDRIISPLTIIHGTDDNVISYQHAEKLQKKSNCRLVTLEGGDHNLQFEFKDRIIDIIQQLI
jgi:pimeloyl-ACP methyl ester carboxylesterase